MTRAKKLGVAAAVALALLAPPAAAQTKITYLYTAVPAFLSSFVAKDQGFFDKRGLDVTVTLVGSGTTIPPALVSNSAQIGGPTPTVLLQANDAGLDLVVVAATDTYPSPSKTGVIAREGSGIQKPQDLAGKKVGVPGLNGIIDVLVKKWVQEGGVDYRRVTWIEVAFPQMGDALKSGQVDAVGAVDPFHSRILATNAGYFVADYATIVPPGTMPILYASTRDWATKNPAAVKAFREALDEAIAFIGDGRNAQTVRETLAKYSRLPPQVAATLPIPNNLTTKAPPGGLDFWVKVAREQGMIKGTPDPAKMILP